LLVNFIVKRKEDIFASNIETLNQVNSIFDFILFYFTFDFFFFNLIIISFLK